MDDLDKLVDDLSKLMNLNGSHRAIEMEASELISDKPSSIKERLAKSDREAKGELSDDEIVDKFLNTLIDKNI